MQGLGSLAAVFKTLLGVRNGAFSKLIIFLAFLKLCDANKTEFSVTDLFTSIQSFELTSVYQSTVPCRSLHIHYFHTFHFEVKKIVLSSLHSIMCLSLLDLLVFVV